MALNDIYDNKSRYERFVNNLDRILNKPKNEKHYYCKNKNNLKYFKKLIRSVEVDDLSYIRRNRLINILKFLTYMINCDLKDINTVEKEDIIIEARERFNISNLEKVKDDIKHIGKRLFSEKDMPNFFKELKIKVDKSRQTARKDKLTYEEFDKIMKYFSNDITTQSYLSIAFESLVRPQELVYTKIKDLELYDNYAKINISEHGKEGLKKLLVIDAYPYLMNMINQHKDRKNKNAFLFLNKYVNQLTPQSINKKLKLACKKLGIDKPITSYSIKRFGVTHRRLMGDDDVTIQRIAGWSSIKQLKTYDLSDQEDVFKIELAKRGLLKDKKYKKYRPQTKPCQYCGELIGFAETKCSRCSYIVDRDLIKERVEKDQEVIKFFEIIKDIKEEKPEFFELLKEAAKKKGIID